MSDGSQEVLQARQRVVRALAEIEKWKQELLLAKQEMRDLSRAGRAQRSLDRGGREE